MVWGQSERDLALRRSRIPHQPRDHLQSNASTRTVSTERGAVQAAGPQPLDPRGPQAGAMRSTACRLSTASITSKHSIVSPRVAWVLAVRAGFWLTLAGRPVGRAAQTWPRSSVASGPALSAKQGSARRRLVAPFWGGCGATHEDRNRVLFQDRLNGKEAQPRTDRERASGRYAISCTAVVRSREKSPAPSCAFGFRSRRWHAMDRSGIPPGRR